MDGIPLIFWHSLGLGGNGAVLEVGAPALLEAGFRPIAPDAPGFGRSPAMRTTWARPQASSGSSPGRG